MIDEKEVICKIVDLLKTADDRELEIALEFVRSLTRK